MKKRHLAGIVIIILCLITVTYLLEKSFSFRLNELEKYISSFGPWGPLLLLLIIIITSSIGFVYVIPVAIAALLLNIYLAFFISILGLTLGALISFYASRYFARDYFERRFRKKVTKLNEYDRGFAHEDFLRMFFLRLINLVPYELVNIGAGLSRIGFLPFILATVIGIIPGTIITIYFVKSTQNIFSVQFLFASILMIAFSLPPLLSKKIRKIIFNIG
jgi:uncharacterized membrane protein YdjX (TVP38/TMEM64 family)